jgi:hypothetical protein
MPPIPRMQSGSCEPSRSALHAAAEGELGSRAAEGAHRAGAEAEPAGHLAEIASQLHAAYVQVAAGLPGNTAVQVEGGKLKLGKAADPKLMPPIRQLVNNMLPKVDFPELLLEVAELTGLPDAFTHISGALTTMEDFCATSAERSRLCVGSGSLDVVLHTR